MEERERTDNSQSDSHEVMKVHCHNCMQKLDVSSLTPFDVIHCPKCDEEIIVPMWFDHYLFEEHVGESRFANVYRALDLILDREVAVKVLKKEFEKRYGKLFLEAARKAAKLNHFSITPIYSCGSFEGQSYFVAQYISEGTLADVVKQFGPQPISKALPWMIEVTEGLEYASKNGMVHHAVCLEHMPLVEGRAKISDFSSSFFEGDSPELDLNDEQEDNLDIFNLGVSFYRLLTGREPSATIAADLDIPENIQTLILTMLTDGLESRISYGEILRVLRGGGVNSLPNSVAALLEGNNDTISIAKVQTSSPDVGQTSFWQRWHKLIITVVLLLLLAVMALMLTRPTPVKIAANVDYLSVNATPNITMSFRDNDIAIANKLAMAVLQNSSNNRIAKQEAAVLLIIGSMLNNDRKLTEKCDYVSRILRAADISEYDPIFTFIEYPAGKKVSQDELLAVMSYSSTATALAQFMIAMNCIYYGCSREKMLKVIRQAESAMLDADRNSWVYKTLHHKLTAYASMIKSGKVDKKLQPNPVLIAYLKKSQLFKK